MPPNTQKFSSVDIIISASCLSSAHSRPCSMITKYQVVENSQLRTRGDEKIITRATSETVEESPFLSSPHPILSLKHDTFTHGSPGNTSVGPQPWYNHILQKWMHQSLTGNSTRQIRSILEKMKVKVCKLHLIYHPSEGWKSLSAYGVKSWKRRLWKLTLTSQWRNAWNALHTRLSYLLFRWCLGTWTSQSRVFSPDRIRKIRNKSKQHNRKY